MNYDHTFNCLNTPTKKFQLATGYISTTVIFFEVEKIYVKIEAKGHAEYFDYEDKLLTSFDLSKQTGGREVYEEVICNKEEDTLVLQFPIVKWIDNYPNCDGEHDRWDSIVIGYHKVAYHLKNNEVVYMN